MLRVVEEPSKLAVFGRPKRQPDKATMAKTRTSKQSLVRTVIELEAGDNFFGQAQRVNVFIATRATHNQSATGARRLRRFSVRSSRDIS